MKNNLGKEFYLSDSNYENRKFISKFRIADHSLEIEHGRYKKSPCEQRLCSFYNLNEVDDEVHFFLKCDHNKLFRSNLLYDFNISNVNPYLDSLKAILNPENFRQIQSLGSFIKQSLELRTGVS